MARVREQVENLGATQAAIESLLRHPRRSITGRSLLPPNVQLRVDAAVLKVISLLKTAS